MLAGAILPGILSWKADDLFSSGASDSARSVEHLCELGRWAIMIVLGVNGNELRERRLLARGSILLGNIAARSVEEALSSYGRKEGGQE